MDVVPTSPQNFMSICLAVFDANWLDWRCKKETKIKIKTILRIFSGENEGYQLHFTLESVVGTMVITYQRTTKAQKTVPFLKNCQKGHFRLNMATILDFTEF